MGQSTPRILLVRLSAIGDCIHALPVLEALKDRWPDAFVGWAIQGSGYALLRGHPKVDRFHLFLRGKNKPSLSTRLKDFRAFRRELKAERYDVVLDLQGLTKSAVVGRLSGAPRRIGFAPPQGREISRFFYTEQVSCPPGAHHVVEKNLALLGPLGLATAGPRFSFPSWERESKVVDTFLARHQLSPGEFTIVNPGTTWETKRWLEDKFAELASRLVKRLPVVVPWGDSKEKAQAETIVGRVGQGAILAPPTTLPELGVLIARSRLFIGNDTGPMHLAAGLGIPTLAVFGATDPVRNGPYGDLHRVVTQDLDCRPCWSASCSRGDTACLAELPSSRVFDVAEAMLDRE